jgi:alkylation response protein AidB-like acyl-CoA dehydrogenase
MRFAFTDDQLAFAEAVRDLFDKACTPAEVRVAWERDDGRVPGLWSKLTEMGVVGLLAPEGTGGLGMTELDMVLLLAESGRAASPEPLADVATVIVPALRDHAQSDDATSWLQRICDGDDSIAVGLGPDTTVARAETASAFLLDGPDGLLHLVDRDVVEITPLRSVDGSRRLARVAWTPSPATRMSGGPEATQQARDRAALAAAAELVGLSDRMIELTVGYVGQRKQFGVPIGSFQAIKHHLADATLGVEFAKPVVWRAAASITNGDPAASVHASMAKAAASDAAQRASDVALQCHGAIGYTVEYDLHLSMKRAWALIRRAGDARFHRRRVAAAILD